MTKQKLWVIFPRPNESVDYSSVTFDTQSGVRNGIRLVISLCHLSRKVLLWKVWEKTEGQINEGTVCIENADSDNIR